MNINAHMRGNRFLIREKIANLRIDQCRKCKNASVAEALHDMFSRSYKKNVLTIVLVADDLTLPFLLLFYFDYIIEHVVD